MNKKLPLTLLVLALVGSPVVFAAEITPFGGGTYNSYGNDTINESFSLFTNNGIINNNNGSLTNVGGRLNNLNRLNNYSILQNNFYSELNNQSRLENSVTGTFDNFGAVTNSLFLTNFGAINNSGTLTNDNSGLLFNYVGGLDNVGTLTNNGYLDNGAGAILTNSGTLEVSASGEIVNTHNDGIFNQTAGTTINNGSIAQTAINITGGSISGSGDWTTTGGSMLVENASINPGNSPGTMNIFSDFMCVSCTHNFEFGAGGFDVLNISGSASFTNAIFSFNFLDDFIPTDNELFSFLNTAGTSIFNNISYTVTGLAAGYIFNPTFDGSGAFGIVSLNSSVPEPSSLILLSLSLFGLRFYRRKKRS